MSRVYRLSQWLIVLVAVVGGVSAIAEDRVPPKVREVMDSAKYKQAHWGLLAVELKTGEVRYELNSEKLFAPASTTKCFSVACALDAFGADHRFETPIVRRGEVNDKGELTGDLILIASGDLTLGGRTTESGEIAFTNGDHTYASGGTESELTPQDPLVGLNELARQVAQAGIKRVRGDVLIDDRLFDKAEGSGSGPGRITPIYVNDNLFDFTITPTKAGQPAEVKWRPESKSFRIETHVETVAKGGKSETSVRDLGSGRIGVSGRIAEAHKPVLRVLEVADASSFARTLLIEALNRQGVDVEALAAADHPADKLPSRRNSQVAERREVRLAAVRRERSIDPESQPQPARQHAAAARCGKARRADPLARFAAATRLPQASRRRCGHDFVRWRCRWITLRLHDPRRNGPTSPLHGHSPRLRRLSPSNASTRHRRHAREVRRGRKPGARQSRRQDRHAVLGQCHEFQFTADEQGSRRLHDHVKRRHARVRPVRQQRPAAQWPDDDSRRQRPWPHRRTAVRVAVKRGIRGQRRGVSDGNAVFVCRVVIVFCC